MMFRSSGEQISKKEMMEQLTNTGSSCKICTTNPEGFVFNVNRSSVHCPRCGMPPYPLPPFMSGDKT